MYLTDYSDYLASVCETLSPPYRQHRFKKCLARSLDECNASSTRCIPVSGPGMPSPPRLMGPNMATAPPPGPVAVPISNASPQLLPAPYLAAPGVIYTTPPPLPGASAPYQVPLGYTSPPPTAPPPTLAQQPVASPQVGGGGVWLCARLKVGFPEFLALVPFCGKDCVVLFLSLIFASLRGFCDQKCSLQNSC